MRNAWRRRTVASLLACLLLAACARSEEKPAPPVEKPVCLLTGFEPFGGLETNPSYEMLKPLAGQTIGGHRIEIAQLPVVYDEVATALNAALEKHKPRIVVCFGVGTPVVQVERIARNGYHPVRPKDNKGKPPPRDEIIPGGRAEIPTQLPAPEILRALKAAGIGAADSRDAGGYLCNECFYRIMSLDPKGAASTLRLRGFVHVPPLGQADPEGGAYTLEKLTQATRLIVVEAAKAAARGP